jgi:hypothetical protein
MKIGEYFLKNYINEVFTMFVRFFLFSFLKNKKSPKWKEKKSSHKLREKHKNFSLATKEFQINPR